MIASTPKFLAQTMPFLENARVDGGVLLFSAAVALLAGILFGLAPGLQIFKTAVQDALAGRQQSLVSGTSHRFRNAWS